MIVRRSSVKLLEKLQMHSMLIYVRGKRQQFWWAHKCKGCDVEREGKKRNGD